MTTPRIVSQTEWLKARKNLLAKEKAFNKARDTLSAERQSLPWVKVEKSYEFDTPTGRKTLGDLFEGKSQLVVYHFMYGPDAKQPCKSCSFWADNLANVAPHLAARDTALTLVSRAPLATLQAVKKRLGWTLPWVSTAGSDFNYDFGVSFRPEALPAKSPNYNYGSRAFNGQDAPGMSVFAKDASGAVCHTYSTYGRGLDMLNGAYHVLDLVPKGRDEAGQGHKMGWVQLRDEYPR